MRSMTVTTTLCEFCECTSQNVTLVNRDTCMRLQQENIAQNLNVQSQKEQLLHKLFIVRIA